MRPGRTTEIFRLGWAGLAKGFILLIWVCIRVHIDIHDEGIWGSVCSLCKFGVVQDIPFLTFIGDPLVPYDLHVVSTGPSGTLTFRYHSCELCWQAFFWNNGMCGSQEAEPR